MKECTQMNLLRSTLLATIAAGACSLSFAQSGKKPAPPVATISKVVTVEPIHLDQIATVQLADGISTSLYQGNTLLFVLPCDGSWPTMLNVDVELKTTTMLNACGDGLTDGVITLRGPTKEVITGPLMAVNTDNGDLTGMIEGRANIFGPSSARLRAVFHAVFVPDANGAYTVVNVDTHGVLFTVTPPAGKK